MSLSTFTSTHCRETDFIGTLLCFRFNHFHAVSSQISRGAVELWSIAPPIERGTHCSSTAVHISSSTQTMCISCCILIVLLTQGLHWSGTAQVTRVMAEGCKPIAWRLSGGFPFHTKLTIALNIRSSRRANRQVCSPCLQHETIRERFNRT